MPVDDPLDNPVWAALTGAHAHLSQTHGAARRYPADVSPFCAFPVGSDPGVWSDLAALAGVGAEVGLTVVDLPAPGHWPVLWSGPGVQLVGDAVRPEPDPDAVVLGPADVPAMLDLVDRTSPGPFLPRTIELGRYLGLRRDGRLVAMAGERMRVPGFVEISAVCTDPAYRRQGLAGRLVRALAVGIRAAGATPFLHAAASNTGAIGLYHALGFHHRRDVAFRYLRVPA